MGKGDVRWVRWDFACAVLAYPWPADYIVLNAAVLNRKHVPKFVLRLHVPLVSCLAIPPRRLHVA